MRLAFRISLALSALALSACGGGGASRTVPAAAGGPAAASHGRDFVYLSRTLAYNPSNGTYAHLMAPAPQTKPIPLALTVPIASAAVNGGSVRDTPPPPLATLPVSIPLTFHAGGVIQSRPHAFLVFWGSTWNDGSGGTTGSGDPNAARPYLTNFLLAVGKTKYLNDMRGFTDGSGTPGIAHAVFNTPEVSSGVLVDTTSAAPPATITQADVGAEALRAMALLGNVPSVNDNYIIVTPSGVTQSGFGDAFCAYHSWITDPSTHQKQPFTLLPYVTDVIGCGAGFLSRPGIEGFSIVGAHELAETMTDPIPVTSGSGTGYQDAIGQEVGDKCAWTPQTTYNSFVVLNAVTYATQPLWNQAKNACRQGPGAANFSPEAPETVTSPPPAAYWSRPNPILVAPAVVSGGTVNFSNVRVSFWENVVPGSVTVDTSGCPSTFVQIGFSVGTSNTFSKVAGAGGVGDRIDFYLYGASRGNTPQTCSVTINDGVTTIDLPVTATSP